MPDKPTPLRRLECHSLVVTSYQVTDCLSLVEIRRPELRPRDHAGPRPDRQMAAMARALRETLGTLATHPGRWDCSDCSAQLTNHPNL